MCLVLKPNPAPVSPLPAGRRRWLFRLAAVCLGLSLLPAAELLCRLTGLGELHYEDPFVGFKGVNPLFELSRDGRRYEVAPAKLKFFSPESFPAEKPPGAFRIFHLGGSTVKGRPYSKETAFSTWLELALEVADPDRHWESINCGGISYASYRLVHILRECLNYSPDLFVICTGHNEFLEDRSYARIKSVPRPLALSQHWASRLRVYRALRSLIDPPPRPDAEDQRFHLPDEVQALLDYRGGLEVYDRNEAWRDDVVRHFEHNLRAMIAMARDAGVPVILIRPPCNLRNSPPFKSQHRDGLSLDEVLAWEREIETAQSFFQSDPKRAIVHLQAALAIDDRYASTWYGLGKCCELLGRRVDARRAFERALEEDVCPLRMIRPLVEAMERVATETRTPLIDAHRLLERDSRLQILGNDQLVDHIHPSIEGHQRIANALLRQLERDGFLRPAEGWEQRRDAAWRKHFDTLDAAYFAAARRALHGLNQWAAGRAEGLPIEGQPSPMKRRHSRQSGKSQD